jgi:hypothetical protein
METAKFIFLDCDFHALAAVQQSVDIEVFGGVDLFYLVHRWPGKSQVRPYIYIC